MLQRLLRRQQRATHGANGALRQGCTPGQTEAALFFICQFAAGETLDISRTVGQGEYVGGAQFRAQQFSIGVQAAFHQVIAQQAKLLHGEAVVGREGRAVVVVIDQRQAHGGGLGRKWPKYGGRLCLRSSSALDWLECCHYCPHPSFSRADKRWQSLYHLAPSQMRSQESMHESGVE